MALALPACSSQVQNQPAGMGAVPLAVQHSEECSMLGIMACNAMSMLSGDATAERKSTCTAYRTANGTRVETCGSVEVTAPKTTEVKARTTKPQPTGSGRNILAWADNSNNESNFIIERCDQVNLTEKDNNKTASCAGGWKIIGTVAANVTQYVDDTAIAGQTYLYRVKATNKSGSSGYTNEAVIKTPPR
ncbi:MAG: hypothetical protein ACM3TN_10435 [Alphaproteobacteria bacterium]